jgi:hypothetical protein
MEFDWLQVAHHNDMLGVFLQHSPLELMQVLNQDILGEFQKAWTNFVQTGQVWALIIGFVIGYILKALLSY